MSKDLDPYTNTTFDTAVEAWEWIKENVPAEDVGLLTVSAVTFGTAGVAAYGVYWLSKEIRSRM